LASQGNANAEARILAVYVKKSRSGASIAADASRKTERLRVRITRLLQIEDSSLPTTLSLKRHNLG
jgi:hypothetical protein